MTFLTRILAALALVSLASPAYAQISTYSTTAASNTTVGGVSVAEGSAPGALNDAIRAVMSDLASYYSADGQKFTGLVGIGGSVSTARTLIYDSTALASRATLMLGGGTFNTAGQGGSLVFTNGTGGTTANLGARIRSSMVTLAAQETSALAFDTNGGSGLTERVRIDQAGNLLVGISSGSTHVIKYDTAVEGGTLLTLNGAAGVVHQFNYSTGTAANAVGATYKVNSHGGTGRSINAGGTINASGADFAEYMTKAANDCGAAAKGQILGVDGNGELTCRFDRAHSFVIVSSDPAYIGNDKWGIGLSPDALKAAEARVEVIAFAGQVPVNVRGARPGQYIVAAKGPRGSIVGKPSNDNGPNTVGKVWKILPDGRAWVKVV